MSRTLPSSVHHLPMARAAAGAIYRRARGARLSIFVASGIV